MKFKRAISLFICLVLLCCSMNITAFATENQNENTVYVDGIAFSYSTRDDGTIEVKCKKYSDKAYLTISPDGSGVAQAMDENGEYVPYELEINELSGKKVDISATHRSRTKYGNNRGKEVVERFNSVEDIVEKGIKDR